MDLGLPPRRLVVVVRAVEIVVRAPQSPHQQYSTLHPTFADAHTVYWGLTSSDPDWGEVWRRDIRMRRIEHATTRVNAPFVLFAQDGDASYYAVHSDPGDRASPLKLHRLDGLVFERAPKLTLD